MEIEIKQAKLNKALKVVSRVANNSRTALPILNNVLIRVKDKKASLVATDLDKAIISNIPVSNSKDGDITVPAKLLAEFVDILPSTETIKMVSKNNKLNTSTNKYNSTINGVSAEDFPELPDIDQKTAVSFKMKVADFNSGLGRIVIASSNDLTRPALTGVYFNTFEGNLYVAATDGYRLADQKFLSKVKSEIQAIIPTSSIQEVMRCISDDMDEIEMIFDESQVKFRLDNIEITSKLIDGSYPDYRQLIPRSSDVSVEVDKDEFIRVVKLAALFAREVGGSITCETNTKKNTLTVTSVANEFGENASELPVKADKDVKVTVNARFLLDALNVMGGEKITLGFSNKMDPIVLRSVSKTQDYTHIVMPLKSTS